MPSFLHPIQKCATFHSQSKRSFKVSKKNLTSARIAVVAHDLLSDGTDVKARVKLNTSLITVGTSFIFRLVTGADV